MAITLDYMVLADMATAAEGKLYIHGAGWNRVFGPIFPLVHNFSAAVRLNIPWNDTNRPAKVEIDVVDEDGASIFQEDTKPQGELTAGRPPDLPPGDDQVVSIAFRIAATFPKAGMYGVEFKIGGEVVARSAFRVVQRPAAPGPE